MNLYVTDNDMTVTRTIIVTDAEPIKDPFTNKTVTPLRVVVTYASKEGSISWDAKVEGFDTETDAVTTVAYSANVHSTAPKWITDIITGFNCA